MSAGEDWNRIVAGLPGAHWLQTAEWAQVKAPVGWKPLRLVWRWDGQKIRCEIWSESCQKTPGEIAAAAQVLQRSVSVGKLASRASILYVPKGPALDWGNEHYRKRVLSDLQAQAAERGAIFIKVDPDIPLGTGIPDAPDASDDPTGASTLSEMQTRGWIFSEEQIQFRNTVQIDLTQDEDTLLARMKQKMRYNVRLAERKGVTIRTGSVEDIELLYRMYAETSIRDGFVIRDQAYYHTVWETFFRAGLAEPLIAQVEGEPVAALVLFYFAEKAWYIYGMSREAHREKMPNALLQWTAMRVAKARGCRNYDLWGAPDEFSESDPMWGVFRFKEGLGGQVVRTMGAWDWPARPLLYRLYTQVLPRALDVMRRRGKERTRQNLSDG